MKFEEKVRFVEDGEEHVVVFKEQGQHRSGELHCVGVCRICLRTFERTIYPPAENLPFGKSLLLLLVVLILLPFAHK